ncbi:hypothetical protein [Pseudomonas sp. S12(2018)]|uniref:hypothetical protein n=1 Tax=Pseudomonas sp. S12(2018) TaxID=2219664 RepID=UPI0020CE7105|nr:hypothetical protein [Pseudomonas sp. S12(2018)]
MNPVIINCIGMAAPADVEPLLASSATPSDTPYDSCYLLATNKDFLDAMGDDDNAPIRDKLLARLNVDLIAILFYCKKEQAYQVYQIHSDKVTLLDKDFNIDETSSIDLSRLLEKHSSDSFIHGGDQYHFATPSHNHTNAFFRLGDSIRNRDDLDRVTFWLLKHIDLADYVFIDSWSIAAIPLRALQILSKETAFDALPAHPAKKMVDCKSVVCAPTPALKTAQNPLLLVSVVSSGSLVEKFQEIFNEVYPKKTLSTVSVYSFSENNYSLCIANYNVINYNFDDCKFCESGSKAIEIHPSAYYVKDPKDSGISLTPAIARMGYSFFEKYHAHLNDIVTFHKGDTSKGNKHYAYFLDYNQIAKTELFQEALQKDFTENLTPDSVVLSIVDEPAIKLATTARGAVYRHTPKPANMIDADTLTAIKKADKVLIYDTVTISGNSFTRFNNFIRQNPELSDAIKDITFLAGVFRPASSWRTSKLLRNSLGYQDPKVRRRFDHIEYLVLPDVGPKECPWCLELSSIQGSLKPALKSSGNFYRRVSKLSNLVDGVKGIDAVFHIDHTSETVLLGAESVLAPTDTAICGVILAVASALQQLRTNQNDKARLAPGFPYTQVLDSANFVSYSEGLIRSALIRNAAAIEFGVVEKEKTIEILLKELGDLDQSNMLSEYIIAVICGKLPPSSKLGGNVNIKLQKLISESPEVMKLAAV